MNDDKLENGYPINLDEATTATPIPSTIGSKNKTDFLNDLKILEIDPTKSLNTPNITAKVPPLTPGITLAIPIINPLMNKMKLSLIFFINSPIYSYSLNIHHKYNIYQIHYQYQ